jgi:hypothetical protein
LTKEVLKLAEQSIKDLIYALAEGRITGDDYQPVELEAFSVLDAIKEALTSTQCEKQPAQEQQNPMCMTKELESLLFSVNGDCYLGFEQEEKLVFIVRKQYEVKDE